MGLVLYYGAGSPYAWRVLLALEHKQLAYERVTLSFSKRETHTPEYAHINPRKQVPALCDAEFSLYESAAIVEYLEERYPDTPRLFPADTQDRAVVRRMITEADTYIGRAISTLAEHLFVRGTDEPLTAQAIAAVEGAAQRLRDELAFFENLLVRDYLAGSLSAADLSLYPLFAMIARFELRKPDLGVSPHIGPRTHAWMRRIEALPYFDGTYPAHWRA